MKSRPSQILGAAVFALAMLPTSLGLAQAESVSVTTLPAVRLTIAPGAESPVSMLTFPDAACTLHPEGASDDANSMKLYADAEGSVRIHVKANRTSSENERFALDCAANSEIFRFPLELRAASAPTLDMPSPQASPVATPKGAYVRPALAGEEARQLSDEQVLKRGYPPRPDAAKSPKVYAAWLKVVSKPATFIPARTVSVPGISHERRSRVRPDVESSSNWCGYELQGSGRTYDLVLGEWLVPPLKGEPGVHTYSGLWVGLDGDQTNDLVQAGTSQENIDWGIFSVSGFYAWSELLPNQPTGQRITSVAINPYDDVIGQVWIGDANGTIDQNGGYAWFYLHDFNNLQYVYFSTPLDGTYFTGSEAEWIMERPSVNNNFPDLADYGLTGTWYAYALNTNGTSVAYSAAPNLNITMYNNYYNYNDDNVLSEVIPVTADQMWFFWQNFH
jgi:hypothetical protein